MTLSGSPYRPIALRMRDDLRVVAHSNRGEPTIVVGDMLSLEFYRLNEQEFFLLQALDGQRSADDIKREFEAKFAPFQVRYHEIQQYLIDFHSKSLVISDAPDQGRHLFRQGRKKTISRRIGALRNLLAIRFRGINPDKLFRFLTPLVGWFFTKAMVLAASVLMLAALGWLGAHYDEFQSKLPSMQEFFSGRNWILLACVLGAMKVLHELGHGIVFSKYGGRCHELGVMFLVFMPTLYVNTSDSWRIDDKWKRAAIAAAGIYVELFLAALATFGWWFSQPGMLQYVFLNVMFLGSVSAFLFNGNPLLKFDAYYLLSDVLEIPNLQQRGQRLVRNAFLDRGLGIQEGDEHLLPAHTKRWLSLYLLASYAYRIAIVYFIAFMIVKLFRPAGLEVFAKMFSFFTMSMILLMPAIALIKYFWVPGRIQRIDPRRGRITAGLGVAGLLFFFMVPLPDHVVCDFVVQPEQSESVYVHHDAVLKEIHVKPMQRVVQGQPIATLRNIDVELQIAELTGQLQEITHEQRMVRLARYESTSNAGRIRDLRQQRITAEKRLTELTKIQKGMVLRAPRDGIVMSHWQRASATVESDSLQGWDGYALSTENINTALERGQAVCKVGDLNNTEARILIDQSDIRFVKTDQSVRLLLDSYSSKSIQSRIVSISEADSDQIASNLTQQFGGSIESQRIGIGQDEIDQTDAVRPQGAVYEAIAPLPSSDKPLDDGIRGTARIAIRSRTLAGRLHRFLQKTFRFEL